MLLPSGFTYINDPRIILSLDYTTHHNFLGRPVRGYEAKVCISTERVAKALIAVQDDLDDTLQGYRLKIFDAYRPATAVMDFKQWAEDAQDQKMKSIFYPHLNKNELFDLGYLAEKSSHSRGSAVDLTLISIDDQELNMGTIFDYFDETSYTDAMEISEAAKNNRLFLKEMMEKHGFVNYPLEWWHYTLKEELFPDTYFDFPVK